MLGGVMASYARVWGSFVLILVIVVLDAAALIATFACFRGPLVAIRRQVDFHGDSFSGDAETPREAVRAMPGVVARRCAARGIFRSRRSLICAGGIFLASSAVAVLEPLVPMYLDETFKWAAGTPVLQGLVFSIATLSYLIATPLAGCIAASVCVRERKHLMQCVGLITVAIGVSLVALPAHLWEPHATLVPTVAGLFLIGTSMGVVDAPAQSILHEIADAERYGDGDGDGGIGIGGRDDVTGDERYRDEAEEDEAIASSGEDVFFLYDLASSLGLVLGPFFVAAVIYVPTEWLGTPLGKQVYRFELSVLPLAIACLCWAPMMLCTKVRARVLGGTLSLSLSLSLSHLPPSLSLRLRRLTSLPHPFPFSLSLSLSLSFSLSLSLSLSLSFSLYFSRVQPPHIDYDEFVEDEEDAVRSGGFEPPEQTVVCAPEYL